MKLAGRARPLHLTYCTNIHAGETWQEVRGNLERYVLAVKSEVLEGSGRFGVGLRLSAQAAERLEEPDELAAFREFLDAHDLYVFTINGFPYGAFHGTHVKENVYLPDWLEDARITYSDRLARILAELLPDDEGLEGSVSTVPGAFKARVESEPSRERLAENMLRHGVTLHRLRERTGRRITLALEPEPACHFETIAETVDFFERRFFSRSAIARFSQLAGIDAAAAESFLRDHIGVCFDACHMAVEFEDPRDAVRRLAGAGIRIQKFQISAGLKVAFSGNSRADRDVIEALRPYAEAVYLHQVVERRGRELIRHVDLGDALDAAEQEGTREGEWRVHFHVPLFREQLGLFTNTQDHLRELLELIRLESPCQHLEVETYSWDVLPAEHRTEGIVSAVSRELAWVMERLSP